MNRLFLIAMVALCAALAAGSRAQALTEVCPAAASPLNLLDGANGTKTGTTFSYELDSLSPETVSGTLSIQTNDGWYQVPFGTTALAEHRESYIVGPTQFVRTNIFSGPLYVRFPKPVSISRAFVSTVTTDDTTFGWPTKAGLECDAGSSPFIFAPAEAQRSSSGDVGPVHADLAAMPPSGASVALAAKTAAFDSLGCAMPFMDAHAVNSIPPDFPGEGSSFVKDSAVKVIVAVAIDATGRVTDGWTVMPGPMDAFNRASLKAAEATTYGPAISRCRPVPAIYLFHAEFSRD